MQPLERMRRRFRITAPRVDDAALAEMRFQRARVRLAELERRSRALSSRARGAAASSADAAAATPASTEIRTRTGSLLRRPATHTAARDRPRDIHERDACRMRSCARAGDRMGSACTNPSRSMAPGSVVGVKQRLIDRVTRAETRTSILASAIDIRCLHSRRDRISPDPSDRKCARRDRSRTWAASRAFRCHCDFRNGFGTPALPTTPPGCMACGRARRATTGCGRATRDRVLPT